MTGEHAATVTIDGHEVPVHLVDHFYDGRTGERVTDEEWDESRDRARKHDAWPFDHVDASE